MNAILFEKIPGYAAPPEPADGVYVPNTEAQQRGLDAMPPGQRLVLHGLATMGMRLKSEPVRFPPTVPEGICLKCFASWVRGVERCRAEGLPERRAAECCHPDLPAYNVAFVRHHERGASSWVLVSGVPFAEWNELLLTLTITNGDRWAAVAELATGIAASIGAGYAVAQRRSLNSRVAGAGVLMAVRK
jgi:hypothetical protein